MTNVSSFLGVPVALMIANGISFVLLSRRFLWLIDSLSPQNSMKTILSVKRNTSLVLGVVIFLVLFSTYNVNQRTLNSVDALPNLLMPVSILKNQDFTLSEFNGLFEPMPKLWNAGFIFGALQYSGEDVVSSYPVGTPLLATPVYGTMRVLGWFDPLNFDDYRLAGKISASAMVALSAVFFWLALLNVVGLRPSLWLVAAYGLGTAALSTASQDLWQHAGGMLCISIALLAILKIDRGELDRRKMCLWVMIASLALTMAVICRGVNAFVAVGVGCYLLVYHRRYLLLFSVPAIAGAVWLLRYNYSQYGNLSGGYDAILGSQWHQARNLLETGLFHHPFFEGLLGTWLSPSKGILIYSPFLVFAFAPLFFKHCYQQRLLPFLYLALFGYWFLLAKNSFWWGGTAFGPRYFLEVSAPMILLIAFAYAYLSALWRWVLKGLIIISITINTFGVFYAPCGWADEPNFVDFHVERLWSWKDPEILRCLKRGYHQGPIPANLD